MSIFFLSGAKALKMSRKISSAPRLKWNSRSLILANVIHGLPCHDNICNEIHIRLCHLTLFKAILIKTVVLHYLCFCFSWEMKNKLSFGIAWSKNYAHLHMYLFNFSQKQYCCLFKKVVVCLQPLVTRKCETLARTRYIR